MGITSKATIDTTALAHNYKQLNVLTTAQCEVGAVVKANGYGAGMHDMSAILSAAGCRYFYTAQLEEAISLRKSLPRATIIVFEGPQTLDEISLYKEHELTLVINSVDQFSIYQRYVYDQQPLPFWVHIDTGMARLGLSFEELLETELDGLPVQGYMSHLAHSDEPSAAQNRSQLNAFNTGSETLPKRAMSLANSGGIFLGSSYHFQHVRPGLALHGYASHAQDQEKSGLKPILRWDAPILQIRSLNKGDTVGYGASFIANAPIRVATIGAGYADGYKRGLQDYGHINIGGYITKPIGRISMDLMVIDVTHIPEGILENISDVCLLGAHYTAQDMANDLNTIPYEVLTSLGDRVVRVYDA